MNNKMNYKRLLISLLFPQLAGWFGIPFTSSAIPTWYATLEKPFFNPPNWIFGPVWTLLYLMMGISIYLIWQKIDHNKNASRAITVFWIHLVFNASWSVVFFGLKNMALALLNIVILWVMILVLIFQFWKIDKRASYLLFPYLAWVSFATALNYALWMLN